MLLLFPIIYVKCGGMICASDVVSYIEAILFHNHRYCLGISNENYSSQFWGYKNSFAPGMDTEAGGSPLNTVFTTILYMKLGSNGQFSVEITVR